MMRFVLDQDGGPQGEAAPPVAASTAAQKAGARLHQQPGGGGLQMVQPNGNAARPQGGPAQHLHVQEQSPAIEEIRSFLAHAPRLWTSPSDAPVRKLKMANGEEISCVLWKGRFFITGTDVVKILTFRFHQLGRGILNPKKFEEGVFSDLRNLKAGSDAVLEEPRSEFLEFLHKHGCIRTQKKQKVFLWHKVPHDDLFREALERNLKRVANVFNWTHMMSSPDVMKQYMMMQAASATPSMLMHLPGGAGGQPVMMLPGGAAGMQAGGGSRQPALHMHPQFPPPPYFNPTGVYGDGQQQHFMHQQMLMMGLDPAYMMGAPLGGTGRQESGRVATAGSEGRPPGDGLERADGGAASSLLGAAMFAPRPLSGQQRGGEEDDMLHLNEEYFDNILEEQLTAPTRATGKRPFASADGGREVCADGSSEASEDIFAFATIDPAVLCGGGIAAPAKRAAGDGAMTSGASPPSQRPTKAYSEAALLAELDALRGDAPSSFGYGDGSDRHQMVEGEPRCDYLSDPLFAGGNDVPHAAIALSPREPITKRQAGGRSATPSLFTGSIHTDFMADFWPGEKGAGGSGSANSPLWDDLSMLMPNVAPNDRGLD